MFTKEERDMMITGLQMRRNYIQTGTRLLSLADLANLSTKVIEQMGGKIQALDDDQMQLCLDTNKLIDKLITM